jgi:8-oxo-dGTP diphosphatase
MIIVTAAVIRDREGRVLLTRRPPDRHMGGLWEFPGGKLDSGETPAGGLVRELREELGITVAVGSPLTFAVHQEPGLLILLLFFSAAIVSGVPRPLDGQELAWVATGELLRYPTPPADAELVRLLADGGNGGGGLPWS